jgi:glycosyltransferase involved in cell wall biosynthesis
MAMSVPAAASAVGGVAAVVRDDENGLLVAPGDVAALANALGRLLRDAALRARLGQAARRTIEDRFTLAARVAAEEAIYDRVLTLECGGLPPLCSGRGRRE